MSAISENHAVEQLSSSLELQRIEESELENVPQNQSVPISANSETVLLKDSPFKKFISQDSQDSVISLSFDDGDSKIKSGGDEANLADLSDSLSDHGEKEDKDSGCEVLKTDKEESCTEETPFEPPDEELANRIVAQVEFYFSDVNITKDAFLLKHVKRNKEGYVSLKLISSFKRVKHLAKDWRQVAFALQKSTKLEINEQGTKLRRVDPLPAYDQTAPSRTIVAINLPMEKPAIESVAELFKSCGEIALIRILRPGNPIPTDVRSFFNKHPEMGGTVSALIEFERTEYARVAVEKQDSDWRVDAKGMKVVELNATPSADKKKRVPNKKTSVNKLSDGALSSSYLSSSEAEDARYRQRRSSSPHPPRSHESNLLLRRLSMNRESASEASDSRPSCSCCCDRRYSSSGSGYDSPVPSNYRRYSFTRENRENSFTIPYSRRFSGADSPCCARRFSRDSGSESSGSYSRAHELTRRFSRDSNSGSEGRRYSRDSVTSDSGFRRISRDSLTSEHAFIPAYLSRSNSRDVIETPRRSSSGTFNLCEHHGLPRTGSRTSFGSVPTCGSACPPHMPENVVRLPKGPDGSKGFGHA